MLAVRSAASGSGGWNFYAFQLATSALLLWVALGLAAGILTGVYHGVLGAAAGDPYCATLRTGTLTLAALLLAGAGCRPRFSHLGQLVYPLMLLGAYRLLVIDLHHDRKVALFLSLLLYGASLMLIPRLRRPSTGQHRFAVITHSDAG